MATNYPGSLDSGTQQPSPSATTEMDDSGFEHDVVHTNHSGAIIALETKVGTGDSNAVANSVLAGTGSGTSGWTTGTLANAISGNAATATALETARTIDITGDITASAVAFDGTANIAISASVNNDSHTHNANNLTGSTLASGVTASSLTSVGTLTSLTTSGSIDGPQDFTVGNGEGEFVLFQGSSNQVFVQSNGTYRAYWNSSGHYLPYADSTYEMGSSSSRWKKGWFDTVDVADDLYIGSNGRGDSWSHFYDDNSNDWRTFGWDDSANGFYFEGVTRADQYLFNSVTDDGLGPVTGTYGSVQTRGTGANNWEGYSINGQQVFMGNGTETCGIYNDVDNQWLLYFDADTYTRLYDSDGIVAFGANDYTTGGTGAAGNGYVGVSTYCGGFSGTTAVMSTTTVAGASMKRLGFSSSSYEYKTAIADLAMSDEAFMSLRPITFHPNNQYVDSTGNVTEIVGGHTIVPDSTEAGETDGLMPLRRAGFGLEDLYGRDDTMILASEFSPDPNALVALLTQKLQETMTRVAALEAA